MAGSVLRHTIASGDSVVRRQLVASIARCRRFSARHRVLACIPVCALAVGVGFGVNAHVRALDRARQSWEQRMVVVSVRHPISAGSAITADDISLVEIPVAGVASAALHALPAGAVALDDLAANEVLLPNHLLGTGTSRLPPGFLGVNIRLGDAALPLRIGDAVAVIAVTQSNAGTDRSSGEEPHSIADRAVVVAVSDKTVVIAVAASAAAQVAEAAALDRAVLVLLAS